MKIATGCLALFLALAICQASAAEGEVVTLSGKFVDMLCYSKNHKNDMSDHVMPDGTPMANCGQMCAKMGIPVGLLEGGAPGGKVYVVIAPPADLAGHIGKEARVTGEITEGGAIVPTKLEAKNEAGGYTEIAIRIKM